MIFVLTRVEIDLGLVIIKKLLVRLHDELHFFVETILFDLNHDITNFIKALILTNYAS